uniref:Uncharacterized protein n=1 Tax=viral metagenome TaxID=1070528 RepID=A0A6C0CN05_9ZZZZ
MFIDFYSIHSINNGKVIIGYTEYFSKYFHITVTKRNYQDIKDIPSNRNNVIIKSNNDYFLIQCIFYTQYIKSNKIIKFDYKKHNIPENIYLMIISLICVR